jgi:anthranilate phosphoribosyltransferase
MNDTAANLKPLIAKVANGECLNQTEAVEAFDIIMSGNATPAQIGGFLMALRVRGETVDEITGAAKTMRAKALKVSAPDNAMDIVGTGGDGSGSYNISTAAAIVTAACGIPIAKHGNRNLSSKSGASDVLASLGVNLDADLPTVEKAIDEANIGFLMAPLYHGAMKHVGGPRVELGTRTIFNLLGPLTNPAGVKRQFSGAFSRDWIVPMATVLGNLGCEKAWVVHGSDGLDELTTTGLSYVAELSHGKVNELEVSPEDAGIERAHPQDLKGGDPDYNAKALKAVVDGISGPYRDVVLYNCAAALLIADKATNLKDGVAQAKAAIDDGRARETLDKLVAITNG